MLSIVVFFIFTANASLNFSLHFRDGIDRQILMDECEGNWITGLYLTKDARCKISSQNGGYYGLATLTDLKKLMDIQHTAYANVSLQKDSTIQILIPDGHYQIMVNSNKTTMHVYSLEKMHQIKRFHKSALSILGDEYVMIKKCQIQKTLLPQQMSIKKEPGDQKLTNSKNSQKSKTKQPFVWTEKDKETLKSQAKKFEELAEMHSAAAALYESKEKKFFV